MILLALLPTLCWILLFLVVYHHNNITGGFTRLRIAFLFSTLLHSLVLLLVTEGLGAFSVLTRSGIVFAWSFFAILLFIYIRRQRIGLSLIREILNRASQLIRQSWMVWITLLILFVSFLVAVINPINNYDSLTYHMGRVVHWIQNRNISYYQTHILRQLILQPFAEMEILHLQLLSGTDRLAQTVQIFFFAGTLINVSLITKELGGNRKQQLLSSFFAALIPAVVLESNTTQNDIVVSFFILAFVYFTLQLMRRTSIALVCWSGLSLGLAWLSKGTAYLFCLPFVCWYLIPLIREYRQPLTRTLKKGITYAIIPLIALSINFTFYYRNVVLTGSPLGGINEGTNNEGFDMKSILLVGIKDLMNHFPISRDFKYKFADEVVKRGIDINDTKYNLTTIDWMADGFAYHEDYMQNFVHVVLIILATIFFFLKKDLYRSRISYYTLFLFSLLAACLLYVLLLKWQPWANRLQAPLFLLFSSFLAIEISKINKWLRAVCLLAMLYLGVNALLYSKRHPILPVSDSILSIPHDEFLYYKWMIQCRDYINTTSIKKIGLVIGKDDMDYQYFKLLKPLKNGQSRIIEHVFVDNESSIYRNDLVPDAIISKFGSMEKYTLHGRNYYRKVIIDGGVAIFEPAPPPGQPAAQ